MLTRSSMMYLGQNKTALPVIISTWSTVASMARDEATPDEMQKKSNKSQDPCFHNKRQERWIGSYDPHLSALCCSLT